MNIGPIQSSLRHQSNYPLNTGVKQTKFSDAGSQEPNRAKSLQRLV
jgi:hypothetical protein